MSTIPPPTTKSYYGHARGAEIFIHQTLHSLGYSNPETPLCTLDNPIHPLFAFSMWTGISKALYTTLTPALQLSSLWITDDRVLDWFYEDTMSIVRYTKGHNGRQTPYLCVPGDLRNDIRYRAIARQVWNQKLAQLASVLKIQFHDGKQEFGFYGCMHYFNPNHTLGKELRLYLDPWFREGGKFQHPHCRDGGTWKYTGTERLTPLIQMSHMFRVFFERKDIRVGGTEWMNGLLFFATTLCHELAHAVTHFPRFQSFDRKTGFGRVAFHDLHELESGCLDRFASQKKRGKPESGFSWEWNMFRGVLFPHSPLGSGLSQIEPRSYGAGLVTPLRMMRNLEWWNEEKLVEVGKGNVRLVKHCSFVYPTEYLLRWFRKDFWDCRFTTEDLLRSPSHKFTFSVCEEVKGRFRTVSPGNYMGLVDETVVYVSVCRMEKGHHDGSDCPV